MSTSQRKRLLELFFSEHSHLANIDKIFAASMKTAFDAPPDTNTALSPPDDVDVDDLIASKQSYEADAAVGSQSFTVPWMTRGGTFVINGVEKVPLIQEIKARNVVYTSQIRDKAPGRAGGKGLAVISSTRFPYARVPVRLVLMSMETYLDVSAISHQLEEDEDDDEMLPKNIAKVPLEMLIDMFGSGVDVVDVLTGMGASNAALSMLLSSFRPSTAESYPRKEILVENIFNLGLDDAELMDDIIINTVLFMFNECVSVYFGRPPSDRDDYANKLLRTSGDIIAPIVADTISRRGTNFARALDTKLMSMMRTGNITVGKRTYPKMVVQVSKRSTFDVLSSVRKIAVPCDENSAGIGMRQLHPSQTGFVCLSETPEGKTTGLVKSLALTCVVSPALDTPKILQQMLGWIRRQRNGVQSKSDDSPTTGSLAPGDNAGREDTRAYTSPRPTAPGAARSPDSANVTPDSAGTTPQLDRGMLSPLREYNVLLPPLEFGASLGLGVSSPPLGSGVSLPRPASTPSGAKSPVLNRQTLSLHTSPLAQRRASLRRNVDTSSGEEMGSPVVNLHEVDRRLENVDIMYYDNTKYVRTWLMFDGIIVGYFYSNVGNDDVYTMFRGKFKKKYKYVSISHPSKLVVDVRTWGGRPMRPLLVVPDTSPVDWRGVRRRSWKDMVKDGLIEYLDPSETNLVQDAIAQLGYNGDFTSYKYMEIHPCTLFGVPASLIPFANHNQSARNIFASSMIKQAMQLVPSPPPYHEGKYLVYGQRPLVDTISSDMLGLNASPNGVNLVVCVLAYTGYNMEDAIIVNKSSVDNGLFFSLVRNVHNRSTDGSAVCDDDEILLVEGDGARPQSKGALKTTSMKRSIRQTAFGGTRVTRTTPPSVPHVQDGRLFVKDDEYRELSVGDKIASRHAQKGVVGRIMDTQDMPFTSDGICPDIIFNPHGIPSRMTMGQLLEGVVGTQCAIDGSFFDGTPFSEDLNIDDILEMERDNSRPLYSGISGEEMGAHHLGTIYYMPLKHQSKDKVYVRWVGPNELFSRQPVAGKKKGGGLKFGEMEMDAMISHGAANAINDTVRQSDMCNMPVCSACGLFPSTEEKCNACQAEGATMIEAPYSLKVFSDLCKCANVLMKVEMKD